MKNIIIILLFFYQSFSQKISGNYHLINSECDIILKIDFKNNFVFNVLEKKKYEGKIKLTNDNEIIYIAFENFGGMVNNDTIFIQNSGNSINSYIHFEECDEKYLHFVKKQKINLKKKPTFHFLYVVYKLAEKHPDWNRIWQYLNADIPNREWQKEYIEFENTKK